MIGTLENIAIIYLNIEFITTPYGTCKLFNFFLGAGISSVVVSFFLSTYYNVIIAYTLFYLFSSFRKDPPWGNCNNRWNSVDCWTRASEKLNKSRPMFPKTPEEEYYM